MIVSLPAGEVDTIPNGFISLGFASGLPGAFNFNVSVVILPSYHF
jgi:hypothetical protein